MWTGLVGQLGGPRWGWRVTADICLGWRERERERERESLREKKNETSGKGKGGRDSDFLQHSCCHSAMTCQGGGRACSRSPCSLPPISLIKRSRRLAAVNAFRLANPLGVIHPIAAGYPSCIERAIHESGVTTRPLGAQHALSKGAGCIVVHMQAPWFSVCCAESVGHGPFSL